MSFGAVAMKNLLTAQEMGKLRWHDVSAEKRSELARKAANARRAKFARELDDAKSRIPKDIVARVADVERVRMSKFSFYYTVGFELGLAQLDRRTRTCMLRALKSRRQTLERERRALADERFKHSPEGSQADEIIGISSHVHHHVELSLKINQADRQSELLKMTLAALKAPALEQLLLDREKLAAWNGRGATGALRAILADPSVIALVPSSYRPALLYGLRAGTLGEAMAISQDMKRGVRLLD